MDAKQVIEKFGGQSALARLIGKGQSTVAYWAKSGTIPLKWHHPLLALAMEKGIPLTFEDLAAGSTGTAAPAQQEPAGDVTPLPPAAAAAFSAELTPLASGGVAVEESPFLFYASEDGAIKVQVMVAGETVWATQRGMAEIFDIDPTTVGHHIKNIYQSNELELSATAGKFPAVQIEGGREVRRELEYFNLDVIIAVGYRVNSYRATQFRRWATGVLKEYLIKGFVLDDERLKQGGTLFGKDYFDELLERIREIRASERRFYQKITDIYAQCSVDYDPQSPITQRFYAHVQDKLHYAIHGHTASELIELRADASKPHMGLTTWKNANKGGKVTKLDARTGKNYLTKDELDELNRLVTMYLDFAENFVRRRKLMRMQDWIERLDGFLEFNAYNVLHGYGRVSRDAAERHAAAEYEKFRVIQDRDYRSDFDRVVQDVKVRKLPKESQPV